MFLKTHVLYSPGNTRTRMGISSPTTCDVHPTLWSSCREVIGIPKLPRELTSLSIPSATTPPSWPNWSWPRRAVRSTGSQCIAFDRATTELRRFQVRPVESEDHDDVTLGPMTELLPRKTVRSSALVLRCHQPVIAIVWMVDDPYIVWHGPRD